MALPLRVRYRPVLFERWHITVTYVHTSTGLYLAVKQLCAVLGLDSTAQLRRIKADARFREALLALPVPTGGGAQTMKCLPRREMAWWLASINPEQVNASLRPDLRDFQAELMAEADRILFGDQSGTTRYTEQRGIERAMRPTVGAIHEECPRCHALLCLEMDETGVHLRVEDEDE